MQTKSTKWNPPGWPWELEIIIFLLLMVSLFAPVYFGGDAMPDVRGGLDPARKQLATQMNFLGTVAIIGVYVLHIMLAATGINRVTVSPVHFLSPLVMALIAHYRIAHSVTADTPAAGVQWVAWQIALVIFVSSVITLLLMMVRRHQYMKRFAGTSWLHEAPAAYAVRDYLRLIWQWRPLLYPPRKYRACAEGLIIEGAHYAMAFGFSDVQSMALVHGSAVLSSGQFYAGSSREMIRIGLYDSTATLWIAPANAGAFLHACQPFITRRKVSGKAVQTRYDVHHAAPPTAGQ